MGKYTIVVTSEFKKNFKLCQRRGLDMSLLKNVVSILEEDGELPATRLGSYKELKESNMYIKAFEKSTLLAEKRNVPKDQILRNKADIDSYFKGGNA